jgi:hypothetical protein
MNRVRELMIIMISYVLFISVSYYTTGLFSSTCAKIKYMYDFIIVGGAFAKNKLNIIMKRVPYYNLNYIF